MSLLPRPVERRYRVQSRTELLFVPPVAMEIPPVNVAPVSPPAHSTAAATKQSDAWAWHVYAAIAIAVAAPMYGRLTERTPYLITLASSSIWIMISIWSLLVPATVLLTLALLMRANNRLGNVAVQAAMGFLAMLMVLGVVSHRTYSGGFGWCVLLAAMMAGGIAAFFYRRWVWLQALLKVAAIGSCLAPASLAWTHARETARPAAVLDHTVDNPIPIVLVTFDCFCGVSLMDESRQIDADRFPNFAELSKSCSWYRNCSSVHPRTLHALPALLRGKLSESRDHEPNLFTLLQSTGKYRIVSFEPFTTECPPDRLRDRVQPNRWTEWSHVVYTVGAVYLHDLVPPDIPFDTPSVTRAWFGLDHPEGADRNQREGLIRHSWDVRRDTQFEHFLNCLIDTQEPHLWFGHFALPHFPWCYLPTGHHYRDDDGIRQEWGTEGILLENWTDDEFLVRQGQQQYLLQTGYTDLLIGKLLARLRESNVWDRCLLIVAADHGVSFRPGVSSREPTDANLAEIMSVPLFIKLPNQQSADVVDLNVETTDILPTILDLIRLSPSIPMSGQSLLADFNERPLKRFQSDKNGKLYEVDAAFEGRFQVLADQLTNFGSGRDPLRIYKIGPATDLLGKRVDEVKLSGNSSFEIKPINFAAEVQYDESQRVPTYPEARVSPQPSSDPVQFAVVINDVICGTTQTGRATYLRDYWRCMLPESSFRPGPNAIRIFEIRDNSGHRTLAECSIGELTQQPRLPN